MKKSISLRITGKIFIMGTLLLILLFMTTGIALADNPMTFSNFSPSDNSTVSGNSFSFSVQAQDLDGFSTGSPPYVYIYWPGSGSNYDRYTVATTPAVQYSILSPGPLTGTEEKIWLNNYNAHIYEGKYRISLIAKDAIGNYYYAIPPGELYNWYVNLCTGSPVASNLAPAPGTQVVTNTPTISAFIQDTGTNPSGVKSSSILMQVDGVPVTIQKVGSELGGYTVSYTPAVALSDGVHNVVLTYTDNIGTLNTTSWSITVKTVVVNNGPVFTSISPADNAAVPVNAQGNIRFTFGLQDSDGVQSGADNMVVTAPGGATYPLTVKYFQYGSDQTTATIIYDFTPPTESGTYQFTMVAKDKLNNSTTLTQNFKAVLDTPQYTSLTPANNGYSTNKSPTISAQVTDASGINPSTITMTVDGNVVTPTLTACTNGYIVSYVPITPFTDNSNHTTNITTADNAGNIQNNSWSWQVLSPPQVSNVTPASGSSVVGDKAGISLQVSEPNDGIDASTIAMSIDARVVIPKVTILNDGKEATISYAGADLSSGTHTVSFNIKDKNGTLINNSTACYVWSFNFTSQMLPGEQEMATNNDACSGCHTKPGIGSKLYNNFSDGINHNLPWPDDVAAFDDIHSVNYSYGHEYICYNCHNQLNLPRYKCALCHGWDSTTNFPTLQTDGFGGSGINNVSIHPGVHGNSFNYSFTPLMGNSSSPTTNFDCIYCHQSGFNTGAVTNHEVVNNHNVKFGGTGCEQCHSSILTREHATTGRADSSGAPMNCGTCHKSTNASVQNAIANYQPFRFRAWSNAYVNYAFSDSPEFTLTGKEITGARLSIFTNQQVDIYVLAYYDNTWNTVYYKYHYGPVNVTPPVNNYGDYGQTPIIPGLLQATPVQQLTFPKAATKVKISFRNTQGNSTFFKFDVRLDNWQFTPGDAEVTCLTCHPNVGNHVAVHNTNFDSKCATCHDTNLQIEHIDKRSKTCASCHHSSNPKYGQAIAFKQQNCSDCHNIGHGLSFKASVPADIPPNPSFTWSPPQEAKLYAGESWMPDEFVSKGGLVVISNRISNITGDNVWSWYKDNMLQKGWTVSGSEPTAGSNFYNATFTKGTAKAILWFYGGPNHTAGPVPEPGYRVELIYHS